jgi:hypothetical protein
MTLTERAAALYASATAAILLAFAWVAPAFAELDGDGLDGDALIIPIVLAAAAIGISMVVWRSRRPGPRPQ